MPTDAAVTCVQRSAIFRNGSVRRAYNLLRLRIRNGEFRPDELFVDTSLGRTLATSRSAVRDALRMLAHEGLLERSPRSGTRLKSAIVQASLFGELIPAQAGASAAEQVKRLVVRPITRQVVQPGEAVRCRLALPEGAEVVLVEQLLIIDGQPVGIRSAYFSPEPDAARVRQCLDGTDHHPVPFPEFFRRVYGSHPGGTDVSIEAVACQPSDHELLGTSAGAPVLMRVLVQRDRAGRARSLSFTHLRGDRVALNASLESAPGR